MRCFAFIFILTFLGTSLAFGQSVERQPESAFLREQLSAKQLDVFQLKGQEKVADFIELLEKFQDKSIAIEIRNQCKSMIQDLFHKEDNTVFYFDNNKAIKETTLNQFLLALPTLKQPLKAKQKQSSKTLPTPTDNAYTLTTKIELFHSTKTRQKVNLEIIIRKEIKEFDSNKIEIWQVFLGDMRLPKQSK